MYTSDVGLETGLGFMVSVLTLTVKGVVVSKIFWSLYQKVKRPLYYNSRSTTLFCSDVRPRLGKTNCFYMV